MRRTDPVRIVEAAYEHLDAPVGAWLAGVCGAASFLDQGLGVIAIRYDGFDPARDLIDAVASASTPPEVSQTLQEMMVRIPAAARRVAGTFGAAFLGDRIGEQTIAAFTTVDRVRDALGVVGSDTTGRGALVFAILGRPRGVPSPSWGALRRVAVHLAAAERLRRRRTAQRGAVEAILKPNGILLHAVDDHTARSRTALGDAVRAIDSARTLRARRDPRAALALWRALVAARWSLVETYETDGKRVLVAHRNDAPPSGVAAELTPRERQVAALLAGGRSTKDVAYELGIGASSVETLVARIRIKVSAPTRAALVAMLAGSGLAE